MDYFFAEWRNRTVSNNNLESEAHGDTNTSEGRKKAEARTRAEASNSAFVYRSVFPRVISIDVYLGILCGFLQWSFTTASFMLMDYGTFELSH